MTKINIIGLGLYDGDISLSGYRLIKSGLPIYIRSEKLKCGAFLKKEGIPFVSFDDKFETAENFEEVYGKIAEELSATNGEIIYLTDGSGVNDKVVPLILAEKAFYPACEKASRLIGSGSYSVISAYDFASKVNIGGLLADSLYIQDIDNKLIASEVKLNLGKLLSDEESVLFFDGKVLTNIPLFELDSQKKYDYNCGVLIKNNTFLHKQRFTFTDLLDLVTALRAPDGCPWDREQTHESIRMNTIEEAYEVAEAIDLNSTDKLIEETGDLMLQTVLHAEIARSSGEYDIADVLSTLCDKLIKRHTHVFGKDKVNSGADALKLWDNNKEKLKGEKTLSMAIDDIPKTLPAVMYAEKVAKKAAKSNFDFRSADDIFAKAEEELGELEDAYFDKTGDVTEELGDALFSLCNLARFLGVDAELSLTKSTKKFAERFKLMEVMTTKDGLDMKTMTDEQLDLYYRRAKKVLED